jgi:hypothetical protein
MQARERNSVFPVQFSRVRDDVKRIVDDEAIYEPRKIVVNVGVGYVPILQPGIIWEDGAFKTRWPYNQIELDTHIRPNIAMLNSYARYQHENASGYVLPRSQFLGDSGTAAAKMAVFQPPVRACFGDHAAKPCRLAPSP